MLEQKRNVPIDAEAWLNDHGDYLFRYAMLHVKDEDAAEDLVQDTLLSAVRAISGFEGKSSIRTWLTAILKRKLIDRYRKLQREKQVTVVPFEEKTVDQFFSKIGVWQFGMRPKSWGSPPDGALEQRQFFKVFESCLNRLPDQHRTIFLLREVDSLSTAEIEEQLGIKPSNTWTVLHRARLRLRACIEENWFKQQEVGA